MGRALRGLDILCVFTYIYRLDMWVSSLEHIQIIYFMFCNNHNINSNNALKRLHCWYWVSISYKLWHPSILFTLFFFSGLLGSLEPMSSSHSSRGGVSPSGSKETGESCMHTENMQTQILSQQLLFLSCYTCSCGICQLKLVFLSQKELKWPES